MRDTRTSSVKWHKDHKVYNTMAVTFEAQYITQNDGSICQFMKRWKPQLSTYLICILYIGAEINMMVEAISVIYSDLKFILLKLISWNWFICGYNTVYLVRSAVLFHFLGELKANLLVDVISPSHRIRNSLRSNP